MSDRIDTFNGRTGNLDGSTPSGGGPNWVGLTGDFETATDGTSGQDVCFCNGPGSHLAYLECNTPEHKAIAEILAGGGTQQWVIVRLQDGNNFLGGFADGAGATFLYEKIAGSFNLLANGTETMPFGAGNFLSVECIGDVIRLLVNGVESAEVVEDHLNDQTKCGLLGVSTAFEPFYNSFEIEDLSAAGVIATPATATLTLSTFAPTAIVTANQTVTPTTLALVDNQFAPTVLTPRVSIPPTVTLTLSTFAPTVVTVAYAQTAFRFRNDDGDEDTATWLAAENADISRGKNVNVRLRIQVDTRVDQPSKQYKLQYRKVGDPGWSDVN